MAASVALPFGACAVCHPVHIQVLDDATGKPVGGAPVHSSYVAPMLSIASKRPDSGATDSLGRTTLDVCLGLGQTTVLGREEGIIPVFRVTAPGCQRLATDYTEFHSGDFARWKEGEVLKLRIKKTTEPLPPAQPSSAGGPEGR